LSSDVELDSVHTEEEQKDYGFNEISVSTSYSPSQSSSEGETSNEYLSQGTLKKRKKYTTWTDRKKKKKHIKKGARAATQSCEKCVHHKESEFAKEEAAAAETHKEDRFHSSIKGNPKSKYSKLYKIMILHCGMLLVNSSQEYFANCRSRSLLACF
ncbi:B3 domain-containing transcription factor VRN1-like isoform X2, partial [Fagus crenata]